MRFVIQRVTNAEVAIDGNVSGSIGDGYFVLIGIEETDTEAIADKLIQKMIDLRIFADEEGRTNLSLETVGGSLLLVSQFTLYADCRKGNRPSFIKAGSPEHAEQMYNYIVGCCRQRLGDEKVATGEFGADMKCTLTNDGPFTVILDSEELVKR